MIDMWCDEYCCAAPLLKCQKFVKNLALVEKVVHFAL